MLWVEQSIRLDIATLAQATLPLSVRPILLMAQLTVIVRLLILNGYNRLINVGALVINFFNTEHAHHVILILLCYLINQHANVMILWPLFTLLITYANV